MMTATIFVHPQASFQFLSICHYITSFGLFFYNNDLITIDERNQTIPVLNAFFEYLNKSNNESEAKLQLLQKVLKGSDLYGGEENETLDVEYVNKHYQYIISEALFSHYGNINGYLSEIINTADNLTFSDFKRRVVEHINRRYSSKDYCSPSQKTLKILNPLAKEKVFQDYVWPMFPEPEENMNIMDVNYIYAMVGLKIARSTQLDTSNLTFDNYILLSRSLDFKSLDDEAYHSMLLFFSTPALFFYAQDEKERYRQLNISSLSDAFWNEAYGKLFSYLDLTVRDIVEKAIRTSLYEKLQTSLSGLNSRTITAYVILQALCGYSQNEVVPEIFVSIYKTLFLWLTKIILPERCDTSLLPDLADIYAQQFVKVRKLHNDIEKNSIHEALLAGDLITKLNAPNAIVLFAKLPNYPMQCTYCSPIQRKTKNDTYLIFAIAQGKKRDIYALRQEESALTLLERAGNVTKFSKALGIDPSLNVEVLEFAKSLVKENEDSQVFIQRVADIKTNQFIKELSDYYRDPTDAEKMIEIIKSFIPFYNCVENIKSGNRASAAFSCSLDVLSLLPVLGVSAKYATIMKSSLIVEVREAVFMANAISRAGAPTGFTIRTAFSEFFRTATRTVVSEILSTRILKDFAVASVRTLDPGFELSYQISRFGLQLFKKMFENVLSMAKRFPKIHKLLPSMETMSQFLQRNMNKVVDHTGMVPTIVGKLQDGYEIVRYTFPGGSHFFGPKCLTVFGKTVEMRSMINKPIEIPVVPSKASKVLNSYRRINLKTGKESDFDLELDNNDLLRRVGNFLNRIEWDGLDMNGLRDFDVNYNWLLRNKAYAEANPNGDVPHLAPSEEINAPQSVNTDVPGSSRGSPAGGQEGKVEVAGGSKRKSSGTGEADSNIAEKFRITETAQEGSEISARVANLYLDFDDIPSTSKGSRTSLLKVKDDLFIETKLTDIELSYLKTLNEKGLSLMRANEETIKGLRLTVNRIALSQTSKDWLKEPIMLYRTEVVSRQNVVDRLMKSKGSEFFFNDITLLTSKVPDYRELRDISLETEIRYHLKIYSQCGFLDLSQVDRFFENQYLTFSDVLFTVDEAKYLNEHKSVFILELRNKQLTKGTWLNKRKFEIQEIISEKAKSKRLQSIEKAANFISTNVPMYTYDSAKEELKRYILKMEPSSSDVPTYDKLADDFYTTLKIPDFYDKWYVEKDFIDDVLFDAKLDDISEVSVARKGIDKIYGGIYKENVEEAFKAYRNSPDIQKSLRFEDYYVLRSYVHKTLPMNKDTNRRKLAAFYRLALRQTDEEWVKKPITLYRCKMVTAKTHEINLSFEKEAIVRFDEMKIFSEKRELEEGTLLNARGNSQRKPILFIAALRNQAGIADVGRIMETQGGMHAIPAQMQFVVDTVSNERINEKEVLVIRMHDFEDPTEDRMVNIANQIDSFFSHDTDFYIF